MAKFFSKNDAIEENHSEARKLVSGYVLIERAHANPVNTQIAVCNATVLSRVHGHFFLPVLICEDLLCFNKLGL